MIENFHGKDLVLKTMEGITLKEMGDSAKAYSLQDRVAPPDDLCVAPMPNLYFQRDPFASVGDGVFVIEAECAVYSLGVHAYYFVYDGSF
jgi:arginine deiminase